MKTYAIEEWALRVIERVKSGQPNEDFRVELKSEWPDPQDAARQLAGHANAAGGECLLWLIGVSQRSGVVGASHKELATWFDKVRAEFDGFAPLLTDHNFTSDATTVTALLFQTEHRPYVVRNPAFRKPGGGPAKWEVPWREGTSTRSAGHSDLIRLLVPLLKLPELEVLDGDLSLQPANDNKTGRSDKTYHLQLTTYVVPRSSDRIVIPFHRCSVRLSAGDALIQGQSIRLSPPAPPFPIMMHRRIGEPPPIIPPQSHTVSSTQSEAILDGPGQMVLHAQFPLNEPQPGSETEVCVNVVLRPAGVDDSLIVTATFSPRAAQQHEAMGWTVVGPVVVLPEAG